ncbi:NUMOD4 domain-containing protein [Chryseobacterium cucumeris]|uniref:NUMOD4 domain-containing protein n=1 Tax=Chryseobacterium cucumeris TaxID=1813611 RepID=UPI001F4A29EF|nr:NUMOD4 domain-containing protein [Chryseobacterium cucumeris]
MSVPPEIQDQYAKDVLCNTSLKDLPNEEWKEIKEFENYMISNYGRIKSVGRLANPLNGRKWQLPERIMKLQFKQFFNKHLKCNFYNITCLLSSEGKRFRKSVPRLVYYHFVEKFDLNDRTILISFKDNNRFHLHAKNLERLSISEELFKRVHNNRVKNSRSDYNRSVNQYTTEGNLLSTFDSIDSASHSLGIVNRHILAVIKKERLTAGGFRWFLKNYIPKKEDFIFRTQIENSTQLLNRSLWEKLRSPQIDENNPPACMNLSLKDLPGELWKPIPGFEDRFIISNMGRVKRLAGWSTIGRKLFFKEQILSIMLDGKINMTYHLFCVLRYNGNKTHIIITRLLYHLFVKEFDIHDRTLVVVNKNNPLWDIDLSKLSLEPVYSLLKQKNSSNR